MFTWVFRSLPLNFFHFPTPFLSITLLWNADQTGRPLRSLTGEERSVGSVELGILITPLSTSPLCFSNSLAMRNLKRRGEESRRRRRGAKKREGERKRKKKALPLIIYAVNTEACLHS